MAIEAQELEIPDRARTLLHPTNFHVAKGDKIGLVGRNGAGKTTLTRVITGDMLPTAGKVRVSGKLGYLPQDTHASDPTQTALDRMMSARDIASTIINRIRKAEKEYDRPGSGRDEQGHDPVRQGHAGFRKRPAAMRHSRGNCDGGESGFASGGYGPAIGYAFRGQRRRIELARILFSDADTLILTNRPTIWTPTPSNGCAAT